MPIMTPLPVTFIFGFSLKKLAPIISFPTTPPVVPWLIWDREANLIIDSIVWADNIFAILPALSISLGEIYKTPKSSESFSNL